MPSVKDVCRTVQRRLGHHRGPQWTAASDTSHGRAGQQSHTSVKRQIRHPSQSQKPWVSPLSKIGFRLFP